MLERGNIDSPTIDKWPVTFKGVDKNIYIYMVSERSPGIDFPLVFLNCCDGLIFYVLYVNYIN